jgi:large subunit ribosomal protein L3
MKFILGKKMSMTQIWAGDKVLGVTPIQAGPCVVSQVRTQAKDGYGALQLAFGNRKEKNINKPQLGHFKKLNLKPSHVREFRIETAGDFKAGDVITVGTFSVGDLVDATGVSKGRGFQGVVKRHHFAGGRKSHGNKDQLRMGGSIGPKGPAHVFKGMRMGGRMGGERVTTTNLKIAQVDAANNILYIEGSVPGAVNSLILINGRGDLKVNLTAPVAAAPVAEAPAEIIAAVVAEAPIAAEAKAEAPIAAEAKPEIKPAE